MPAPSTPALALHGCQPVDLTQIPQRTNARTFALKVCDASMSGCAILPGDIAILEHGIDPRSGDVVAALVDNESVLRRYTLESGRAILRASHPSLSKTLVAGDLVIQGVMVRLLRQRAS